MPLHLLHPTGTQDSASQAVDFVLVHGLNPFSKDVAKHAFDTWRKPQSEEGKLWPRDSLPEHTPSSRIWLYEYNSSLAYGGDKGQFVDKANDLLEDLRLERGQHDRRPIIFVAHSLGGILVKQALVNSYNNPRYRILHASTKCLAFFATPHGGGAKSLVNLASVCVNIATSLGLQPKSDIVKALGKGSLFSDLLGEQWRHQLEQYKIVSFWEGYGNIVSKQSATFGLAGDRENIVEIQADHRNICRFDDSTRDQQNFRRVWGNLKELYDHAIATGAQRNIIEDGSLQLQFFLRPRAIASEMSAPKNLSPGAIMGSVIQSAATLEETVSSVSDRIGTFAGLHGLSHAVIMFLPKLNSLYLALRAVIEWAGGCSPDSYPTHILQNLMICIDFCRSQMAELLSLLETKDDDDNRGRFRAWCHSDMPQFSQQMASTTELMQTLVAAPPVEPKDKRAEAELIETYSRMATNIAKCVCSRSSSVVGLVDSLSRQPTSKTLLTPEPSNQTSVDDRFQFDHQLLASRVYETALRGLMKVKMGKDIVNHPEESTKITPAMRMQVSKQPYLNDNTKGREKYKAGQPALPSRTWLERNVYSYGWSKLHYACAQPDDELFDELDHDKNSPLIVGNFVEVHNGADEIYTVASAIASELHVATWNRRYSIVKKLPVSRGNVDRRDRFGQTPLHLASFFNDVKIARLLLLHGADPDAASGPGDICFDIALSFMGHAWKDCVWYSAPPDHALNYPSAVHSRCSGQTPLQIATSLGNLEVMKLLLSFGGDVNACDADDCTAIFQAFISGRKDALDLLLGHSARICTREHGGCNYSCLGQFEKRLSTMPAYFHPSSLIIPNVGLLSSQPYKTSSSTSNSTTYFSPLSSVTSDPEGRHAP